ncbi:MAG: toxin-antitoxin system HicB family antitoxin [Acidobacteriaceae bacterium]|nr:toxin-antitoxin system HicB family antitoxin [Acidobacteriaceae bacterium]
MTTDDARHKSFPLRLPPSLRRQSTDLARQEGISLNHFIGLAIAEKISRMHTNDETLRMGERNRPALALVTPRKPTGGSSAGGNSASGS